jgi:hypothetical protein
MRAIREDGARAARDIEIRLVQQRGRADRRAVAVARQLAAGEPVQLRIERREQRLGGARVAAIGGCDERPDLGQISSRSIPNGRV